MALRSVAVFGSTGQQGGSVAQALLSGGFNVRAITRDANSTKARQLAEQGAEVAVADQHDSDAIRKALTGVDAVFAVTQFWDPKNMNQEVALGTNIAAIAKEAGVKGFVWSGLPDVAKISGGKWELPHFTDKARVWDIVKKQGFQFASSVEPAFYFSNFNSAMAPKEQEDGSFVFRVPLPGTANIAAFDVNDYGQAVAAVLRSPEDFNGRRVQFNTVYNKPLDEWLAAFARVTGKPARLESVPFETMVQQSREMANMFGWFNEYGYYGRETDAVQAKDIPGTHFKTWEEYLATSKWASK